MAVVGGPDEIVADGLVLHLDAANPGSYPGTGTTWYDLSGNGKNATLLNGVEFEKENAGEMCFDGTDDSAYTPSTDISTDSGLSMCLWLYGIKWYLENCPCPNTAGILDWSTGYWNMAAIISNTGGPYAALYASTDLADRKSVGFGATNQLNTWLYLVFTYDNATRTLKTFNNTNSIATTTIASSFSLSARVHLARYVRHCGNCSSNIIVPSVKIYNRALSAQEILQNYNATKERFTNK